MTNKNKLGTIEQATINATKWLESIHEEGIREVEMKYVEHTEDGFLFNFAHSITGKIATLHTHGLTETELDAFIGARLAKPKAYWNGFSTSNPKAEDWLTDEYSYRCTIEYFKK